MRAGDATQTQPRPFPSQEGAVFWPAIDDFYRDAPRRRGQYWESEGR